MRRTKPPTHRHTNIQTNKQTYTHTYMHACMHASMHYITLHYITFHYNKLYITLHIHKAATSMTILPLTQHDITGESIWHARMRPNTAHTQPCAPCLCWSLTHAVGWVGCVGCSFIRDQCMCACENSSSLEIKILILALLIGSWEPGCIQSTN